MATLKNSRGKFFHIHKMPVDRSFWRHFIETVVPQPEATLSNYSKADLELFTTWRPEHSNCEQLTTVIEELTRSLPDDCKALARNLFVGRVLDGEVNARAWSERQAGLVEISLQYTNILGAYAATYDEYFQSVRSLVKTITDPAIDEDELVSRLTVRLEQPWNELRAQQNQWKDPTVVFGGCATIFSSVAPERMRIVEKVVLAAEAFIIAHELAHHLLGHTNTKRDKQSAKRALDEAVNATAIPQVLLPLNPAQRQEVEADALAFLICANALHGPPTFPEIYDALAGSVLSFVAAAHVKDDWIANEVAPTHPGFLERMQVIAELTTLVALERPADKEMGHPLGFLAQLQTFAGLALNAYLHQHDPVEHRRVGLLDVVGHLARLADELKLPHTKDGA
ncbi:hypothetical protein ABZU42_22435 [Micromonospora profundi]|uniref:hypothetical protein n=1 Tax=Micromonospora profundi TaxID=1420889 RepID=UPI0033B315A7